MGAVIIGYFGRETIYTLEPEINRDNVVSVINDAEGTFNKNSSEARYLWDYYKGKQPILEREKALRKEINNKVVENHAMEIADFFSGYFLGEPCSYVRRSTLEGVSEKINELNEMMVSRDKPSHDKTLATWMCVVGVGYRMCLPCKSIEDGEPPFEIDVCDPRNTFVVRSPSFGREVMIAAQRVMRSDDEEIFCGYTKTHYFEIEGNTLLRWEPHYLGYIPIFEFEANVVRMGVFEPIISLLNAINTVASNRIDGVEQFIQSILVLYNAEIDDDVAKNLRELGLVKLKSRGDVKGDIKILNEQLNQSETQTLVNHMVNIAKEIVGMPNNSSGLGGGASGNVGSVLAWQGWDLCEPRMKETEDLFKMTEKKFLRLILKILRDTCGTSLKISDIDVKFSRRNIENLLVKAQSLQTLLSAGISPEIAIATVGLWNDPVNIAAKSAEFLEKWKASNIPGKPAVPDPESGVEDA